MRSRIRPTAPTDTRLNELIKTKDLTLLPFAFNGSAAMKGTFGKKNGTLCWCPSAIGGLFCDLHVVFNDGF